MTTKTSNMDNVLNVNSNNSVKQSVKRMAWTSMLTVALMLISIPATAQVHLGVKGGVKLENARMGSDVIDSDNRIGSSLGVVMDVNIPIIGLGVETGAMFTRRSFGDNGRKLHSIDIPVNARYRFSLPLVEKVVAPFAFTGPEVSFRMNMGAWGDTADGSSLKGKTSLSWNIGAGVDLIKHVRVAAAYNISLSKEKIYRDNSWSLTAAYMF